MDTRRYQHPTGIPSVDLSQVRCLQINLQHSRSATYSLMKVIDTDETDIVLVQEPYVYQNKIIGIDKSYRIFSAGQGRPRAAIIIPNNKMDAMLIRRVSNEDTVLLEIKYRNQTLFAASMYFDIEEQIDNNFQKMDEILRIASGGKILIAVDSNARSKTWHDIKTNTRGRKMEEYLVSNQLYVTNEESERFTFNNNRGISNIDLTIANNNLIEAIIEWEISDMESLSDHNYLKYKIANGSAINYCGIDGIRGVKYILTEEKASGFDRKLLQEMWKLSDNITIGGGAEELDRYLTTMITTGNDLERQIDLFDEALQTACRRSLRNTNKGHKNGKKKTVPWWTDGLTTKRKQVNACRRLYQRTKNDEVLRENRKQKYVDEKRIPIADKEGKT